MQLLLVSPEAAWWSLSHQEAAACLEAAML